MAVPYTFATATSAIPLSQLDANFATAITLGNTAVYLGNTTTSIGNLTLTNVTISSVATAIPNSLLANSSVTLGSTSVSLGATATSIVGLSNVSSTVLTTPTLNSTTTLSLQTGGTTAITVDASQNVGIGTASPKSLLDVNGNISIVPYYGTYLANSYYNSGWKYVGNGVAWGIGNNFSGVTNGVTIAVASVNAGGANAALTWNPAFNIDTSGNVGIGTSSPNYKLDVNGSISGLSVGVVGNYTANRASATAYNLAGGIQFQVDGTTYSAIAQPTAQALAFYTGNATTERMRIDSSGNVLVGTTSGGSRLNLTTAVGQSAFTVVDGNSGGLSWGFGPRVGTGTTTDFGFYNNTGSVFLGRMTSAGVWYQGNNSSTWSVTSDERIKENINTLNNGLSIITLLRPVEFDYKISKKHDVGFIAQEYQKILPEQINENKPTNETKEFINDGKLLGISSNLIPYLVKAIQELSAKVDTLQAELNTLKGN